MSLPKTPLLRSIVIGLLVLAALVIYAYGFQVTKVDFAETRDAHRQEQLVRILRAIAQPDLFEYQKTEVQINTPIYVPCPAGGVPAPASAPASGPYLILTPPCADPSTQITVEGFNFEPNTNGPLNFIPPSGVSLQMGDIKVDADGHFKITAKLPKRPSDQVQQVRSVTRQNVGGPQLTQNARDTWDKIIETVYMALVATTIGTIISIPVSFLASQNLMRPITSPLASVALMIIALPIGIAIGGGLATWLGSLSQLVTSNLLVTLLGVIVCPLIIWAAVRWALPPEETEIPSRGLRLARLIVLIGTVLVSVFFLFLLSSLLLSLGHSLIPILGIFGFLGAFVAGLGDILGILIIFTTALATGLFFANLGSEAGQFVVDCWPAASVRLLNFGLAILAGALLLAGIGAALDWLYQFNNPVYTLWIPAAVGALIGLLIALRLRRADTLPIGYWVYYIARTILNTLRSIEPLILVIVFAVWVGIGPFAGTLALALSTVASLSKLYSEQVENIASGPLEAVTSTGANRLQTVIYAVVPQIVPPYISFTMYRWDINVRASTIIGFAGGGGIGFLLQQNINLLNYRAASTQMLAITVVVITLDFLSTKLREKAV
jgi:phosphonate ABC transporter permease subunit PhnE